MQSAISNKQAAWFKRSEGDLEAIVSQPLQGLIDLEASKNNAVLSGLFDLAAHLLSQRHSTQCTARQALEKVQQWLHCSLERARVCGQTDRSSK
ncbi:hypothetical protein ABBQ32_008552 [Trebouxia sp. C0010 RCD-2024]